MVNRKISLESTRSGGFTPIILLLFVGSGCSALIYEIVWFHLLRLVIGASAISLGVLLASFMGGMCLGSLLFSRVVSRRRHPLRVYAFLELGIGAMAILLLEFLPQVNQFYVEQVGYGQSGILLRAGICLLCLLPPTILMGATLPAISRWMEMSKTGISRMGFFYGANIFGAVLGTLLAGFYLLRVFDTVVATYCAVGINVGVTVTALVLAGLSKYKYSQPTTTSMKIKGPKYRTVYIAIMLSGLTALGAEVLWTRLLSLLFGPTVYTFAIILAVFLVGLGLGSSFGSMLARFVDRPRAALGWCQLLLVGCIPLTAYMITEVLPYWDMNPDHFGSFWYKSLHDLIRSLVAMGPAAFLWGASFPLALTGAASKGQDPGRLVGGVYAANTVGAIGGALLCSLVTVSSFGTQQSQQLLVLVAGLAAVLMFGSVVFSDRREAVDGSKELVRRWSTGKVWGVVFLMLIVGASGVITKLVPPVPMGLIAYGRMIEKWNEEFEYPYFEEGISASVAVSYFSEDVTNFHVSGKVVASSDEYDMRLQRMLGHLPSLIHAEPKSVLIVGCGAGVTAGTFVIHPSIERIVICEIEPRVIEGARDYFGEENYDVLKDPRTTVIYDDARHFLATTDETFDIITSDPIHPWVRGAAALYSAEYFELSKAHLNPGGIVTQWVPFYESSEAAVKSEIATFMAAFEYGTVWNSDITMAGYDVVMLGHVDPVMINVDEMQYQIDSEPAILRSLQEVELGSAVYLLGTYAGQGPDLTAWMADAEINTDRSLRLQYLAGLALDYWETELIFQSIIKYMKYPETLFIASPALEMELRELIR